MAIDVRFSVMSPQTGVAKTPGGPPYGMGGPPGMDPAAASKPVAAKRLRTLDKKTIYLVDTGFGGSYNFMCQLQKWFSEHMPSITIVRKRKPGHVFREDNSSLWDEIKQHGDAVVLGVAG